MSNNIYRILESAINWLASGGSEVFTPTSLAAGAGRQGAYHDFGTAAVGRTFAWRAWLKPGATRVIGEVIEVYWITSDGTSPDNNTGTGDAAVSAADKLRNLELIGFIQIDANAADLMTAHGILDHFHRYGAPLFFNKTANSLSTTAGDYGFSLTPVTQQVQ